MINRKDYEYKIKDSLEQFPVVAVLGPRQCGKTTLVREYINHLYEKLPDENYFDLENPYDLSRLESPELSLSSLKGLIVIDEIQKKPELFPVLRYLVDLKKDKRFLILGSASRDLLKQSSESLAGRIDYIELTPFYLGEVGEQEDLWLKGGFPDSYLAGSYSKSYKWLRAYTKTYLEQDLPNLGINISSENIRRFWLMLTHYHGNIMNTSELGRSLGVSHNTVKYYLDILSSTFMIRQLQPWYENISKRQVKSPKVVFRDSGILHYLLDIQSKSDLMMHPKLGASWEGFALEQVIRVLGIPQEQCYFWATHSGAECDLVVVKGMKKYGYEFKYTDSPKTTRSMHSAIETLGLESLHVITPKKGKFPLTDKIIVSGIMDIDIY